MENDSIQESGKIVTVFPCMWESSLVLLSFSHVEIMNCPYCQHRFPLTWSRYARASFGKHICPNCKKRSKLKIAWPYLVAIMSAGVACILAAIVATELFLPKGWRTSADLPWYIITVAAAFALIIIPFDRYCEERMNRLEKLPEEQKWDGNNANQ